MYSNGGDFQGDGWIRDDAAQGVGVHPAAGIRAAVGSGVGAVPVRIRLSAQQLGFILVGSHKGQLTSTPIYLTHSLTLL